MCEGDENLKNMKCPVDISRENTPHNIGLIIRRWYG